MVHGNSGLFFFHESETWRGKPNRHRRTFAVLIGSNQAAIGIATTRSDESFSRKLGREEALPRAAVMAKYPLRQNSARSQRVSLAAVNLPTDEAELKKLLDYRPREAAKHIARFLADAYAYRWEKTSDGLHMQATVLLEKAIALLARAGERDPRLTIAEMMA